MMPDTATKPKRTRKWPMRLVGLLIACAILLFGLYRSLKHEPAAYRAVLGMDRATAQRESQEFLQHATALANRAREEGAWKEQFTQDALNGWLAVDLVENHPTLLPKEVSDPRIVLSDDRIVLSCRYRGKQIEAVFSVTVEVFVREPNVIAVRIDKVQAGLLPVPMNQILEQITKLAEKMQQPLRWEQSDGDPVALITLPPLRDEKEKKKTLSVETILVRDKTVTLSGQTTLVPEEASSEEPVGEQE